MLIPFRDIESIVEKYSYLIENPDILVMMGKNSKEKVNRCFSLSIITHEMMNLYNEILEKNIRN